MALPLDFAAFAEPKVAKGDCAEPANAANPEAANALADVTGFADKDAKGDLDEVSVLVPS